jgi:CubicO group peptidase (beta-lactamase class C family)
VVSSVEKPFRLPKDAAQAKGQGRPAIIGANLNGAYLALGLRVSSNQRAARTSRVEGWIPWRRHLLLTLACVIGPAALFGQSPSELDSRIARLDASLDVLRRVYSIPSLSAAVVFEQRIIWERGFGFQDIARRVSARPDTPYRTASLTKTFTSALLMQCVEQRTLSLDEPIRQYTAGIPEQGATVRHVLTHTSEGGPGSRFHYNGDRYAELTPVVERCTGEPFRLALARRVLDRLAMRDSVPGQDLDSPTPSLRQMFDAGTLERYGGVLLRLALPYSRADPFRVRPSEFPPKVINAAAGLVSTVRDLASYDVALDRHVLINELTQELAWTPAVSTSGQTLPYGLGWFVQTYGGERLVWHFGSWPESYSSLILKVPARRLTLILLANSGGLSAPFPMEEGDVTASSFAAVFLRIFLT